MNSIAFKKHCKRLGLTARECANIFGYSNRSAERWGADGPPITVAAILTVARNRKHLMKLIEDAQ